MRLRALLIALLTGVLLLPADAAAAHPLGNFTVNHYDAVLLRPDAVELTAVVDRAEIPAAQALREISPGGNPDAAGLTAAAAEECAQLAEAVSLWVDGDAVPWSVRDSGFVMPPGVAGLPTLRLTCALRAPVDLAAASRVAVRDDYLADRLGWREFTADGAGIRLIDPPVPTESISDELRSYPSDLLSSPLDVSSFEVAVEPGRNTASGEPVAVRSGDPLAGALAALDRRLESVVGDRELTPVVGALAVLLALLLGCGHALLPGHGKTVMAAYLAGRRGRPRDALMVGVTVAATHTAGVLGLGLALSLSSTLAGDAVLRWLGVTSGALVAVIGAGMLAGALRERRAGRTVAEELLAPVPALTGAAGFAAPTAPAADHHRDGHHHGHGHDHDHPHGPGRSGLVGMGVAGGLVPSPSALVVLLASIGLGRTLFGVALVFAYGLGMAAVLTAVGLGLVRLRTDLARLLADPGRRRLALRLARAVPVGTAVLVLTVGLALVARGLVL